MRTLLAVLTVALLVSACKDLQPSSPERRLFECRAHALEAVAGDAEVAAVLTRDIYTGKRSLTEIVSGLKPAAAALSKLLTDLNECEPKPAPASAPGEVLQ